VTLVAILLGRWPDSLTTAVLQGYFLLVFLGMIGAAVLLLRRQRIGFWVGLVAMAVQLPLIRIGTVGYMAASYPLVELKLWPRLGLYFTVGGTTRFTLWETAQPFYLGINVVAALVGGWLAWQAVRERL
jgi:hypothetical protein